MPSRRQFLAVALAVLSPAFQGTAHALSLARRLERLPANSVKQALGPGATAPSVDVVTPQIVVLAARGIDFPATSSTPGFTYVYNPELNVYERSSASLGPALLERAETIGRNRFAVGASYLFADLVTLDGHDIQGTRQPFLFVNGTG